jgi:hypothetical protein
MSLRFGDCGQSHAIPNYRLRKEGRANLFAIIPCQVRTLVVWTDGYRKQLHLGIEHLVRALQRFLPVVTSSSAGSFPSMLHSPAHRYMGRVPVESGKRPEYSTAIKKD